MREEYPSLTIQIRNNNEKKNQTNSISLFPNIQWNHKKNKLETKKRDIFKNIKNEVYAWHICWKNETKTMNRRKEILNLIFLLRYEFTESKTFLDRILILSSNILDSRFMSLFDSKWKNKKLIKHIIVIFSQCRRLAWAIYIRFGRRWMCEVWTQSRAYNNKEVIT